MAANEVWNLDQFNLSMNDLLKRIQIYFEALNQNEEPGALQWNSPIELKKWCLEVLEGSEDFLKLQRSLSEKKSNPEMTQVLISQKIAKMLEPGFTQAQQLHSPHCMGHQVAAPYPIASLFEFAGAVLNQVPGVYEMGPFAAAVERALVQKIGELIGWGAGFDGIMTHGGSAANLTALLTARNIKIVGSWKHGWRAKRPVVFANSESHYSVARSGGILGMGADQVVAVPVDREHRMDMEKLEELYQFHSQNGDQVFAVVGSACSTPFGAFDPLDKIAEWAVKHNIWFHVDAAHGGPLLFSTKYKSLLRGIENADSVAWDVHKMMGVAALSTFVMYKDAKNSYLTFEQDGSYLFSNKDPEELEFDGALRTLECTKRALGFGLWGLWSLYGADFFKNHVERLCDQAKEFAALVLNQKDFKLIGRPDCNIVVFEYSPTGATQMSAADFSKFQGEVRKQIIREKRFYITATKFEGVMRLRVTVMNPITEAKHFEKLLSEVRRVGAQILGKPFKEERRTLQEPAL